MKSVQFAGVSFAEPRAHMLVQRSKGVHMHLSTILYLSDSLGGPTTVEGHKEANYL